MSQIIVIEPDPFLGTSRRYSDFVPSTKTIEKDPNVAYVASANAKDYSAAEFADITTAGRPLTGKSIKPDRFAYAQVVRADGTPIKIFSGVNGLASNDYQLASTSARNALARAPGYNTTAEKRRSAAEDAAAIDKDAPKAIAKDASKSKRDLTEPNSYAWNDWILTGVQEQRAEKTQLLETFGANYLYAYGAKPQVLAFTGQLINTSDFNWRGIFWENWDRFFKASSLLRLNARMYIAFDDVLVEGYPLAAGVSQGAMQQNLLPFSLNFLVTRYVDLSTRNGIGQIGKASLRADSAGWGFTARGGEFTNTKKSVIDWLPVLGNQWIAEQARSAADPEGQFLTDTERFIQTSVSNSLAAVRRGAFAAIAGPANLANYLQATLTQALRSTLQFAADQATGALEDAFNFPPGEVSSWFGYMGSLMTRLLASPGLASSANIVGARGLIAQVLGQGSVNQIVDAMSYATVSGISSAFRNSAADNLLDSVYNYPDGIATYSPPPYDNRGALGFRFT